jgi:peptide/nickel transport system substrate-binding protein
VHPHEKIPGHTTRGITCAAGLLLVLVGTARCGKAAATHATAAAPILRVGIGGVPSQTADRGVQQFIGNISNEGLLRVNREGRLEPWLVESWRTSTDGLVATLRLRPHVTFHDGSPLDAAAAAKSLRDTLPKALGAVFEDIDSIAATSDAEVTIKFRRPSPFVLESLIDNTVQKPGTSTGPFMAKPASQDSTSPPDIEAYGQYHLGHPRIGRIVVNTYPNVRAAWADMLRDRLDMLYEVDVEALASMEGASSVSLYTFDRPFQYAVLLNSRSPKLRSPKTRRALNQAVDRSAIVRLALAGHGTPSAGPVSRHHWAFREPGSTFDYLPAAAAATLATTHSGRMSLRCLTPAGPPYERLALVLKQQLQDVGVDMSIDEVTPDNLGPALSKPDFEALLIDVASGWSLFRPYRWFHSKGTQNQIGFSSGSVDAALDRVRHAANDNDYRAGTAAFQQAIADDPPAIFLAWSDRSRAVTRRFDVQAEAGRDVLSTLRLWKPTDMAPPTSQR